MFNPGLNTTRVRISLRELTGFKLAKQAQNAFFHTVLVMMEFTIPACKDIIQILLSFLKDNTIWIGGSPSGMKCIQIDMKVHLTCISSQSASLLFFFFTSTIPSVYAVHTLAVSYI